MVAFPAISHVLSLPLSSGLIVFDDDVVKPGCGWLSRMTELFDIDWNEPPGEFRFTA